MSKEKIATLLLKKSELKLLTQLLSGESGCLAQIGSNKMESLHLKILLALQEISR